MGILDAPGVTLTKALSLFQLKFGSTEVLLSTANTSGAAASNVTALNDAITASNAAGGGAVTVSIPGTYYINDHVLMRSNITLRLATGVVIKKFAGVANNVCMIRNANPNTTRPYTDSNMVIEGGAWDGNYTGNSGPLAAADNTPALANTLLYGIQGDTAWVGVSNLTIRNVTFQSCNGFAVQVVGDNVSIENVTLNTARDGIHINGPSRGVRIRNVYGFTDDDFIAINAWDWHRSGPSVGDIENVSIEGCSYLGTSGIRGTFGRGLKLLPGTRATGAGAGTANIRNVTVVNLTVQDSNGIGIMSDFDQLNGAEYSGAGTVENVTFDTCRLRAAAANNALTIYKDNNGTPADGQTQLNLRNVTFRNIDVDCATNGNANAFSILYPQTGLTVNGLVFRDIAWTPRSTAAQMLNVQSKSVLDAIEIDGVTILGNAVTNPVVLVNTYNGTAATEVKTLGLHRVVTANGVTVDGPVVALNGIVDLLNGRDWAITFTGGSLDNHGIALTNGVALLKDATLTNLTLTNPKELFTVRNGATGSVICKATVRDSTITGATHPIYVQGGRQADIRFRGGNIDTPTNLARVDASTLTLTLDGTTSSGTGATAITQVSATTLRVVKSDRIALPLGTLTLTESDGDDVYSSATPTTVVSGTGAGRYIYRGGAGFVKLN